MLSVFALGFLFFCLILTWAVSGGQPLFGAYIAGVDENDVFYRFFLADEARADLAGPKGGPETSTLKLFSYTVEDGDSLSKIAEKTSVSLDALISLNKLSDAHTIRIGQPLTIPNQKGIYYKVKKGDTIEKLAGGYKIADVSIRDANGLIRDELEAESVIFLPGAKLPADEMEKALGMLFIRPVKGGWISSGYGTRRDPFNLSRSFHPGIDIALPYGTTIVAVRSGTVDFAGWNGGYGQMVSVKHSDGYTSIYGHMQRFIVSRGQSVRAGQVIGYVGSTGYSTGPHLHLELRRYGQLINPMQVPGIRRAFNR
jgi:murein DD-endopeptidase MepM/ murein hydrolase activator NlpD